MKEIQKDIEKAVRVAIAVCRAHEDADVEAVSKWVAEEAIKHFQELPR